MASRKWKYKDGIIPLIKEERDVKDFIFWTDYCTGQNKNKNLFTALIL